MAMRRKAGGLQPKKPLNSNVGSLVGRLFRFGLVMENIIKMLGEQFAKDAGLSILVAGGSMSA